MTTHFGTLIQRRNPFYCTWSGQTFSLLPTIRKLQCFLVQWEENLLLATWSTCSRETSRADDGYFINDAKGPFSAKTAGDCRAILFPQSKLRTNGENSLVYGRLATHCDLGVTSCVIASCVDKKTFVSRLARALKVAQGMEAAESSAKKLQSKGSEEPQVHAVR